LREDGQENIILSKYKRWEKILEDVNEKQEREMKSNPSDEVNSEKILTSINYINQF
jgi:hypothetical protein